MLDTGTVSHYRILQKLGEGGMGIVYKAEDVRLERFVALKFLPSALAKDPQLRDRFLQEARAASALNHPNICTIHDIGEEHGRAYIAMEFLDGCDLKELVAGGRLPSQQLLDIAVQVAEGLEAAHAEGIVHRDMKLANIFVTKQGRAKILDFGLAKKTIAKHATEGAVGADSGNHDPHLTSGLAALGTAAYMSPEQALGKSLDSRTDIFSFGVVLYEMSTGQAPFKGDTTGMLFLSIVQERPMEPSQLNPAIPPRLQEIIQRCLEKDRELRYPNVAELRADLQRLQQSSGARDVSITRLLDQVAQAEVGAATPAAGETPASVNKPVSASASVLEESPPSTPRFGRKPVVALALLLIVAGAASFFYFHTRTARTLKSQDSVVVADFANTTGDRVFDSSLRQALGVALGQSPYMNVVTDRRIVAILKQMERPENERLSREVAREVCLRANAQAYIASSISQAGDEYQLKLQALNCQKNEVIARIETDAPQRSTVIKKLGEAGRQLRIKLGESLPSVDRFDKQLPEATTSSLEALQAYAEARNLRNYGRETIPYLKRAIELDPNFAMANFSLASAYANSGVWELANQYRTRAYELRNRVTEAERFEVEAAYYRDVTGETDKAVQVCEEGLQLYPDNAQLHTWLAFSYMEAGDLERAARSLERTRRLTPERHAPYINLMAVYIGMGRLDEAKLAYEEARKREFDEASLRVNRYEIAFLEDDPAAMQEQLDAAKGRPGYEHRLLALAADTEAFHGHFAKARDLSRQAEAAAERDGVNEVALKYQAWAAWREAEVGNLDRARQWLPSAATPADSRFLRSVVAVALAKVGHHEAAEKLADEIGRKYPLNTAVQTEVRPLVRSMIELQKGNAANAIETLQPALATDSAFSDLNTMEPSYVRGLAYLKLGDGEKAAAQFQNMLDHPGLVGNFVIGALAHLQLARTYEMMGKHEEALTKYQDFLALWKDADPDIPIYRQAKAEYAKLK